jgi:nicotinate-nucleotide adenylyltransferase
MHSIAIFGGTFDPVHNGHILTSIAIQAYFGFDSYYFLPCKNPILKAPTSANSQQRVEMLQLATKNHENFKLDLREIRRDSPSYMVETLAKIREENKIDSITLIMGYDAFLSLPFWHQWKKMIKLANLLVIKRNHYSNYSVPESIQKLLNRHKTEVKTELLTKPSGRIYLFNAGNYDISSTDIRKELKKNKNKDPRLPKEVYEYIKLKGLYQ